jgi:hypothetical protein
MHKFTTEILNLSYKVAIIRLFIWEVKKEMLNLQLTYGYKCLVEYILAFYIKVCDCYT